MNLPFEPQRQTQDYQASDAAHHIHAFVDQKALNAEGPRVMGLCRDKAKIRTFVLQDIELKGNLLSS